MTYSAPLREHGTSVSAKNFVRDADQTHDHDLF
eukprot:CAMPEP_0197194376 /NCGR_PEP_ID=MMETSP1423-20130617/29157_1 /TAXON_ID=476441 /ORGANISM="Pseudo-nitzschia heimii, Strain UNC1101" /LENGTH=32 /DNA_ID= /DNA_START= /DNA_END= /DNA_ORIENTATION=